MKILYITTWFPNMSGKESVIVLPLLPEPLKRGEWQRQERLCPGVGMGAGGIEKAQWSHV